MHALDPTAAPARRTMDAAAPLNPAWMDVTAMDQHHLPMGVVWRWRGKLMLPPQQVVREAVAAWHPLGYTPLLRRSGDTDWLLAAPLGSTGAALQRWARLLAGLTIVTALISAVMLYGCPIAAAIHAVTVIGLLLVHEGGHLLAARSLGVPVAGPFLLPWPLPPLGTLGALILPAAPPVSRSALAMLALAGPLAGLALAIPVLALGLLLSEVRPLPSDRSVLREGDSLLYAGMKHLIFGRSLPSQHEDVALHPLAFAAWLGMLLNASALLPLGMLDGGQICSAALGRQRATAISRGVALGLVIAAAWWPGWLLWSAVGLLTTPPGAADDITPPPLAIRTAAVGAFLSLVAILPLQPFSWT